MLPSAPLPPSVTQHPADLAIVKHRDYSHLKAKARGLVQRQSHLNKRFHHFLDFAFSHIPGGSQSQSSKIVGITSNKQGQSPIKKRARFIPPSIVNSSAQLAETSCGQQCARTRPCKDKNIQLTHIQKRRSPRLKVAMANEEDNGVEGSEVEGDQNKTQNEEQQGPEIQEKQPSNIEASSEGEVESNKSKTRGPTLCAKVHGRIFEEREQIIFNANWQPIGPSDQALSNFSSFLGTIARTHVYCPLTYNSWKELLKTRREEIWDYVNSKYILHAQAKRYVMKTINEAWRIHKCRVKSSHFTKYRTDAERLKNHPLSIPETQFKKLIKYWKTEKVKKLSEMNTTNRALQKWPHRVGPTSFARIRERLRASKENYDSPSQAEIFVTTSRGN
ncbi:putative transposase, Ptta/En/Spm, plant [Senna tora]|uniref:Putative transposase, Ptta/En/Spm, plant n=1 Tax=Senna tora TaxID=362788 RepID=A0A834XA74_9FABA|nr:putative transposase, Ptta/En/Spm, plant [Senna tora]